MFCVKLKQFSISVRSEVVEVVQVVVSKDVVPVVEREGVEQCKCGWLVPVGWALGRRQRQGTCGWL